MSDKRNPIEPGRLSAQEYETLMWNHLKRHEGMVGRIYTDGKGIPSMGVGVALAVQERKNGPYVLRDLGRIGAEISGDPNQPYRFKPEEISLLQNAVGKLNDPKLIKEGASATEAQKLIPPYNSRSETTAKNKFGFTLPEERMKSQAFDKIPTYQQAALNTVREEAAKRGWTKEETDAYVKKLEGSPQEGALTSLRYNGVVAPKTSGALLDGDRVALRDEILHRSNPASNGENRTGIGRRRIDEANMASGDPKTWTQEEQTRWRAIEENPGTLAYRQGLPDVFSEKVQTAPETPPRQRELGADGQAFLERIGQPNQRPALDIATKDPQHWSKDEVDTVIQDYQRYPRPESLNEWLRQQTSEHFKSRYGDVEMIRDLSGRMVERTPSTTTQPNMPVPDLRAAQKNLEALSKRFAHTFDADGHSGATKSMQQGLNLLNRDQMPSLKTDGDWGPITDFTFKKSVASHGTAKVDEGFALGRLQSLAEKPQQPEDLARQTQNILGPLYGSQEQGDDHALALQAGLNRIGPKYQDDWQPLKLDGEIGPKTASAFNSLAGSAGPMALSERIGSVLGWLE